MSKRFKTLNGPDFTNMMSKGAEALHAGVDHVNALNVFPVPDGDTGTNMNMTLTSGVDELKKKTSPHIGKSAEALSKGLLMGARGNSGVILSQLFRGFAKSIQEADEIDAQQFAAALQHGVDTAYKAVVKPVEGTILSVAREAAKHGLATARRHADITELMSEVLKKAKEALAKTPEQLPVLKQVGVVDAGGQGLVLIYEGFVAALRGEMPEGAGAGHAVQTRSPSHLLDVGSLSAQAHMATEDIEFGYCTEFIVRLDPARSAAAGFTESAFREQLVEHGDSLLVIADDDLVKVHVHAEYPGNVLSLAQRYGDLVKIKIENMREQHSHIVSDSGGQPAAEQPKQEEREAAVSVRQSKGAKRFGFVAVAAGEGISAIFKNLGVDVVLSGGQTMNPSTEDITTAVERVNAETVFVLPNNSNIILAAQQARELMERSVIVVPTKTVPQGIAAMLKFQASESAERNGALMEAAIGDVQSGQVTYAVRDSQIDGVDIHEGDYLGIHNNRIVAAEPSMIDACAKLLASMMADGGEVVTVLTGAEAREEDTVQLAELIEDAYPDGELEILAGGQPLYYYLFSVE
ncbi:DAK2 domain-containing protein [Paenibacillus ginsengarvi]|uniref:DAK2 domain-containing protein n=1 Tax=Paenibacillus ginsengarvi TaxID=400777 RepID=A0A3B0CLR6_9BACL|nr:DAK2 domain-containing protein [Paenibacillus ginsengarvi]RKN86615.1 DAK2 domain-containing protein [Paenibacillus ginsengarvi]